MAADDKITRYQQLGRSFFISLTLPQFDGIQDQIRQACDGAHFVELRVDLLANQDDFEGFKKFVQTQFDILRGCTTIDIIYTVRTKAQGGAWPDDDVNGLIELYHFGLRLGAEILDVEMQLESAVIEQVVKSKGSTAILASHHDWTGDMLWADGAWEPWYQKACRHGDIVKLVGTAKSLADNIGLENFRIQACAITSRPLIAINMGVVGQLSRILNPFMTPVTHPALANKAAPGQLSVAEIKQALKLMGLE